MRGMGKIKLVMGIDVNGNDALFPPEGNFRALAARTTVDLQVVRYKWLDKIELTGRIAALYQIIVLQFSGIRTSKFRILTTDLEHFK